MSDQIELPGGFGSPEVDTLFAGFREASGLVVIRDGIASGINADATRQKTKETFFDTVDMDAVFSRTSDIAAVLLEHSELFDQVVLPEMLDVVQGLQVAAKNERLAEIRTDLTDTLVGRKVMASIPEASEEGQVIRHYEYHPYNGRVHDRGRFVDKASGRILDFLPERNLMIVNHRDKKVLGLASTFKMVQMWNTEANAPFVDVSFIDD